MKRRFTLLELLIVIAVISILVAMLLPALNSARERGIAVTCVGNLKHFGFAFSEYSDMADGNFLFADTGLTRLWNCSMIWGPYYRILSGKTSQPDSVSAVPLSRLCPKVASYKDVYSFSLAGTDEYTGWTRPSFYALCGGLEADVGSSILLSGDWLYHRRERVVSPSSKVLQVEANNYNPPETGNQGVWCLKQSHADPDPDRAQRIAYEHLNSANVLYFDLHIGAQNWRTLFHTYQNTGSFLPYR